MSDSSLPTFDDAGEQAADVADAVREHGRALIPWLPDPPTCEQCGVMRYADVTFDPDMVEYVRSWTCRNDECDAPDRYREEPADLPELEGPSEGAPALQEAFDT